ncbi:hypothetical protein [Kineosporia sp. A_224]|uniref:hypothetical protein n=1 Tax=Kineosporia sp. A_224 TaxID=1962180 RepID=UPI000B4AB2EB|nr:hypothetical protein [Kineosporia sp. A_224]
MSGTGGSGWQVPGHDPAAPTQAFVQQPTLAFGQEAGYAAPAAGPWSGSPVTGPAPRPPRRHPVAGSLAVAALLLLLWPVWEYVRVLRLVGTRELEPVYGIGVGVALVAVAVGAGGTAAAFARLRSAWLRRLLLGAAVLGTVLAIVLDAAVQIGYGRADAGSVLLGELGYGSGYGMFWWVVLANLSLVLWAVAVPLLWVDTRRAARPRQERS